MMPTLQFIDASKTFGDGHNTIKALKPTTFSANEGELIAIIGPSGSGKSTFLTIAGGLQTASEGDVLINGRSLKNMREKELAQVRLQDIGFILQASNLVPFLTVDKQFSLLDRVKQHNMSHEERTHLFQTLGIEHLLQQLPNDLSGGERQRVAIAKALYTKPAILLADEPTASLDSDRAFEVMSLLQKQTKLQNNTTIVVTHDTRLIPYFDKVFKMTDGVLKQKN